MRGAWWESDNGGRKFRIIPRSTTGPRMVHTEKVGSMAKQKHYSMRIPKLKEKKAAGSKITGKTIGKFHDFTISGELTESKTGLGKSRVLLQIRQSDEKKWRVSTTLAYAHAVDVPLRILAGVGGVRQPFGTAIHRRAACVTDSDTQRLPPTLRRFQNFIASAGSIFHSLPSL